MSDFSCNVEEIDFDQLVVARSHEIPVLVDISADWCAPCRVLAPLLHKLVVAYSHGVEIDRFHSAQTEGFLRGFIDQVIERHNAA